MNYKQPVKKIQQQIEEKLSHNFGVTLENANDDQYYKAVALIVREMLMKGRAEFKAHAEETNTKMVYYLCMEFLLGRSLKNNLCNLGIEEDFREALDGMGVKLDALYEKEPDAGLGNGGLGRLAACFLDGLASQGYPGKYQTGFPLLLPAPRKDVSVFVAGAKLEGGRLVTSGGRVVGVSALADTLGEAVDLAYRAAQDVAFDNKYCRKDIGARALAATKGGATPW